MNEQDPLKKNRLGLRGMLMVSGAVLAASSVFLLPEVGPLSGSASTTSLPTAAPDGGPRASSDPALRSRDTAVPADEVQPLLPVYWLGEVDGSDRLFREFLVAGAGSTGDPIADAVRLMTSGQPLDPDYRSPWRPASSVSSSISTKNVITLDLSSDAFTEGLGQDEARLAVQQLVYTATAAASNAGLITGGESSSVVVLVDGAAGYRAFDTVDLGGEWTRDTSTLAPVWIIDPQQGVQADTSGLTVHGVGPASAQTLAWQIDRTGNGSVEGGTAGTSLVRNGFVEMSPEAGAPGAYSFSVTLPPGSYEITVSAPSGDGRAQDSKTVTVR